MASVVLWGREHIEYGRIAVAQAAAGAAAALSRGRYRKAYGWVDPNEDVVALAVGPRAALAVAADGHSGQPAAEAAVRAVLERHGQDPPAADLTDDELLDTLVEANAAVLSAAAGASARRRRSRTTLTVALVTPQALQWAAVGDSPLFLVTAHGARELTPARNVFLGERLARDDLARWVASGRASLGAGTHVVAATDGFSNFTPGGDPGSAVAHVVRTTGGAGRAARALVEHAFAGGAGDNVAVAVIDAALLAGQDGRPGSTGRGVEQRG